MMILPPSHQRPPLKKGSEQQKHLPQNEHENRNLACQPISSSHLPPVTTGQYESLRSKSELNTYSVWNLEKQSCSRHFLNFVQIETNAKDLDPDPLYPKHALK
jgi:hypothetical protein